MATLNARRDIRGGEDEDGMSFSLQSHSAQKVNSSMLANSRVGFLRHGVIIRTYYLSHQHATNSISIKIDTTKEYVRDGVSIVCKGYA